MNGQGNITLSKPATLLLRMLYTSFLLLFGWTLCSVCLQTTRFAWLTVTLAAGFVCLLAYANKQLVREESFYTQEQVARLTKRLFLTHGILLVLSAVLFGVFPNTWDFGELFYSAVSVAESDGWTPDHYAYFARYTNNQSLLFYLSVLYKIFAKLLFFAPPLFRRGVYAFVSVGINLCCIFGTTYITWRMAKKYGGPRKAAMVLLLCTAFVPFYLYASIFYSDTLSMPFVAGTVFALDCAADSLKKDRKRAFWLLLLAGAFAYIGFSLKASSLFMLLALLGCAPLRYGWKKTLQMALCTATVFLVLAGLLQFCIHKSGMFPEKYREAYEFPYTHWIMMALTNSGGYNQYEVAFTAQQPDIATRKEENLRIIRQRLKEMGISGLIRHTDKKLLYTWGNGDLNARHYASRNPLLKTGLQAMLQNGSAAQRVFETIYNAYFEALLLCFLCSVMKALKKPKADWLLPQQVALFMLFAFLLVWETNARYLLHYSPVLLISAAFGLRTCVHSRCALDFRASFRSCKEKSAKIIFYSAYF